MLTTLCSIRRRTYMKPARNSMYCVYVGHCQNDRGRDDVPKLSGLDRGRYNKQMYSSMS